MKYAKATGKRKVKAALLNASKSDERYDFLIENHRRAIELLRTVQPHQHRQYTWAVKEERNVCGTAACAFGWVTLTGILDGLRYTAGEDDSYEPVICKYKEEKEVYYWGEAAQDYFGVQTTSSIFVVVTLKMPTIIARMEKRLQTLRRQRKLPVHKRKQQ